MANSKEVPQFKGVGKHLKRNWVCVWWFRKRCREASLCPGLDEVREHEYARIACLGKTFLEEETSVRQNQKQ